MPAPVLSSMFRSVADFAHEPEFAGLQVFSPPCMSRDEAAEAPAHNFFPPIMRQRTPCAQGEGAATVDAAANADVFEVLDLRHRGSPPSSRPCPGARKVAILDA